MSLYLAAYLIICALALLQSVASLSAVMIFRRYVRRSLAEPAGAWTPRALVILPVKGPEPRLEETIRALAAQDYPDYRVCIAVESVNDPSYAVAQRLIRTLGSDRFKLLVSRPPTDRAQKIENLLAAIDDAGEWPDVYVFVDSDAVPRPNWLGALARPLDDGRIGATTGFRWYAPGETLASVIRSTWNAVALVWLGDHQRNFVWGGSMALRRTFFERVNMRRYWAKALSEDYQVARAVRDAGLEVRFVPQCVIPCYGEPSWWEFLTFARRQLIITRVCEPHMWWSAAFVCFNFVVGYFGQAIVLLIGLLKPDPGLVLLSIVGLAAMYAINIPRAILRQRTLAHILPADDRPRGSAARDVLTGPLLALVNGGLMLASGFSNRFAWRNTLYEMRDPDETVVIEAALPESEPAPFESAEA